MLSQEHKNKLSNALKAHWSDERKEAKSQAMTGCTIESGRRAIDKNYVIVSRPALIKAGWFKSLDGLYATVDGKVARVYEQDDKFYVKELVPCLNADGYLQVGGANRSWTVHQVVARAFLGECPADKEINHIDKNRQNNHIENLEYVTHKENMKTWELTKEKEYKGRYIWHKHHFIYPDGAIKAMTTDEYYNYLVKTRGVGIANKIFKAAQARGKI